MLNEDLRSLMSDDDVKQSFRISIENGHESIIDIDVLDYLYNIQCIELRPRIYRGDFGDRLWCVEVYDWLKKGDTHIRNLVGFHTRQEAIHESLKWYFSEYSVKKS